MKTLYNKNVVIFGASYGLSKSVSLAMAKEKANIFAVDKDKNGLATLEREIGNMRSNCRGYLCDLASRKEIEKTLKEILKNHDNIDLLVLGNAAENKPLFLKSESAGIEKIVMEYLVNPCVATHCLLEHMSKRKESAIVMIPPFDLAEDADGIIDGMCTAGMVWLVNGIEKFVKKAGSNMDFVRIELSGKKYDIDRAASEIIEAIIKSKSEVRL